MGREYIDLFCNELAVQKINLSIQLPDDTSLLPIHTDVWSGNLLLN